VVQSDEMARWWYLMSGVVWGKVISKDNLFDRAIKPVTYWVTRATTYGQWCLNYSHFVVWFCHLWKYQSDLSTHNVTVFYEKEVII